MYLVHHELESVFTLITSIIITAFTDFIIGIVTLIVYYCHQLLACNGFSSVFLIKLSGSVNEAVRQCGVTPAF